MSQREAKLLHAAVLAMCDMDDGVQDGIIGNPEACKFDPGKLVCTNREPDGCLTPLQVEAARRLYSGVPGPTGGNATGGKMSLPGLAPGSELHWQDLADNAPAITAFFRYAIADYDNSNPDLRRFATAGGKLIIYHGANDTINLPGPVIDYYASVERTMGGGRRRGNSRAFFSFPAWIIAVAATAPMPSTI